MSRTRERAFTLIELLVAMGLLAVCLVAVSQIFSISSDAAGRTNSHSEIIEAAAAIRQQLTTDLSKMAPGVLIIDSPVPTLTRVEMPGGPQYYRLRHDSLVFIANGSTSEYQSFTHRWSNAYANEDRTPASSSQALLYFGPGIPVSRDGTPTPCDDDTKALPASQWVFVRRAIVLMNQIPAGTDPTWTPMNMSVFNTGMLTGGALDAGFLNNTYDAVVSGGGLNADANTLANLIANKTMPANIDANPVASIWQPNWAPTTVGLTNQAAADYYTRGSTTFQPRLADIRIEWTDGRHVDPNNGNYNTRWFGLAPDPTQTPDYSSSATLNTLKYQARMRSIADPTNPSNPNTVNPDSPATDTATFANIEWSPTGVASDANARYRAIWRGSNFDLRPRALRFTFRLFDSNNRLKLNSTLDLNEDGLPDRISPGGPTITAARFGQEFSFVIPLQ